MKQSSSSMYRVALYIRLSREDGDKEESNSVTNQRMMLEKYVKEKEDLIIYKDYCDDGYTGTNFDRPAFKQMIEDIEKKLVQCVIVKDLSRFGRDYIEVGNYLEKYFIDQDVRFISINDNIDSLRSSYDMLLPIRNIFNQQYALDISQKVQSSFKVKQKEGQFVGAFPSYGYKRCPEDKHKLMRDDYAAEIVKRIYQLYADGVGKISIARILNKEGILCPSEYKKLMGLNYKNSNRLEKTCYWTFSTIDKILKNQMYHGDMVQGKTKRRMKGKAKYLAQDHWIIVENTHQAIIEEELWQRVQRTLKSETRNICFDQNISVFAGFLKCGDCGRALAKNTRNGQVHYVCATYKNYGNWKCTAHRINHKDLENIILQDINVLISSIDNLKSMVDEQIRLQFGESYPMEKLIKEYDEQIVRLNRLRKESYRDYREELVSKDVYIEYSNDCTKKIDLLLQKKKLVLQDKKEVPSSPWIHKLLSSGMIETLDKEIIDEMIDEIYIYQDKSIRIIYKFSSELDYLFGRKETGN